MFANTSVTLDPGADRVIVMDLPYLQKLATLLSDTKPVVVGKLLGILKLLAKIQSIILLLIQRLSGSGTIETSSVFDEYTSS